jgi:hypothetical protein
LVTDWAPCPPVPVLAGALRADAALLGAVVVVELGLELLLLLLQPATASSAAATAAKPILLSLRTVVPSRDKSFMLAGQPGALRLAGMRGPGSSRPRSFWPGWPRLGAASSSA